jgi:5-methylcytosine-specific restriction endonuclease McrA
MPANLRKFVYERDGFTCRLCGWSPGAPDHYDGKYAIDVQVGTRYRRVGFVSVAEGVRYQEVPVYRALVVDHIHPIAKGGPFDDPNNLQALCSDCNGRKGAKV